MKAVWLSQGKAAFRPDAPEPPFREGLAMKVLLAGVCGTDLQLVRGYAGFEGILGHEFVAQLEDQGEVAELPRPASGLSWKRRRVVGEINVPCQDCPQPSPDCARHCPSRTVTGIRGRGGAFAERLRLPACNLHPVDDRLSDEAAVFCEPLAAALQVQETGCISAHESVLVVGAGRLGQLIARVLLDSGCRLQVSAKHASQALLLSRHGIQPLAPEAVPGRSYEVAVEATGSPEGLAAALHAVKPRGRVILKSTYAQVSGGAGAGPAAAIDFSRIVVDEIQLLGSRCGPFAAALRLLESGRIDPRDLIDEVFPLEEAQEALRKAAQAGVLKVLLRP
ncbi:MAG TPA: alcohol dehydrogenase catalytic domain-containing protein [Acidobacteriota bacterium]|nr:alcohol dehydrogenase catalytic domain-containing protein [Acidobacteriota bacterium]